MSPRSLKALTFLYLILVVSLLAIAVLYTRTQESDKANRLFQTMVPVAEQFAETYQTMDSGLRAKTSGLLFGLMADETSAVILAVQDSRGDTSMLWQRTVGQATGTTPAKQPAYSLPTAGFQSEVFETSLPGAFRMVAAFSLLGYEDIQRFAVVSLVLLGVWIVFLMVNLAIGNTPVMPQTIPQAPSTATQADQDGQPAGPAIPAVENSGQNIAMHDIQGEAPASHEGDAIPLREDRDSRFVLIDRKTGVTQERFLRFRLDKELERNAENAMDLSIALFQFEGLQAEDHAHAASLLLSEFNHEDLIFEHGSDSFCVILPQHDLDQAIARAEMVMRRVDGLKAGAFKNNCELTVGLSSRNGRLLDTNRFLKEASIAVKKASREEGRIVGFRPDPVRFRNFLRHQRI